ncbi:MAG: hypothetical protein QMD12_01660 [Candidatus Aenigmarchaeota archaeon]|nr:hypothetical protein [Candidatus Aenigmarchaeota archaeon]
MIKINTLKDLRRELSTLPFRGIVLFITNVNNYFRDSVYIIKILVNSLKFDGIYITINKPYQNLIGLLKKNRVDTEKLFFIDCITKTVGGKPEIAENCLFIASPQNLTELGVALSQAMEAMKGKPNKFLLLDSLSTLLIYNNAGTVARFSHFLTTKIRLSKLKGVFIIVEKEMEEKLLITLSEFCDKVIKLQIER